MDSTIQPVKKILVVGAGIAGPTVCYWLDKYGFKPELIEKEPSIRTGGFAIDIRGIAVDIVKKMDIYQSIFDQRTTINTGRYVDKNNQTVSEDDGETSGFRQGEDVEILRGHLVEILMKKISHIPLLLNTHIEKIKPLENGVSVEFSNQLVKEYDLIIGTDGLHSAIRELCFQPSEYQLFNLDAFISVFSLPNCLNVKNEDIYCEQGSKLIHYRSDKNPHTAMAGLMFREKNYPKNLVNIHEQKSFLKKVYNGFGWESDKILGYLDTCDDLYFDSICQVRMQHWTKNRVALIGDSGYCASLLSGQGSSLALVGAYILAGELAKARGEHKKAFLQYEKILRPFVKANQDVGIYSSETFLLDKNPDPNETQNRTHILLNKVHVAANAITLPKYTP